MYAAAACCALLCVWERKMFVFAAFLTAAPAQQTNITSSTHKRNSYKLDGEDCDAVDHEHVCWHRLVAANSSQSMVRTCTCTARSALRLPCQHPQLSQAARILANLLVAGGTVLVRAAVQAYQRALVSTLVQPISAPLRLITFCHRRCSGWCYGRGRQSCGTWLQANDAAGSTADFGCGKRCHLG